nr:hypothetical protein [Tanacetum cinerariifolium]
MTCSTVKRLTKPNEEPKREFWRRRKSAQRPHQNESLAIAGTNLFDDEASSSYNTGAKPPTPPKTLHEHSHPNYSGFLNPITFPIKQTGRIVDSRDIWLIQNMYTFQGLRNEDPLRHIRHYLSIIDNIQADGATRDISRKLAQFASFRFDSLTEDEGWNRIEEYVQYQDDPWDDVSPPMIISSILEAMQPTLRGGDIYDDLSLLRFYQNDDTPPWGNIKHKKKERMAPSGLLEKQKKDEEDERLLSIFKQIHINLPFLEVMIYIPKGAKVLKHLLLRKDKLKKVASSVKLIEECSVIIQMILPQKERDPRSFILPCLIGPLAVKNALADLRVSINLMPHSLFRRLGIFKLKPTKMSIQLAGRSIKYPIGICENLLVEISKCIFPIDFLVLEMYEDELVPIILGRPFLTTARAVIDVHKIKLSLRFGSKTVTFNIEKSMKPKHSRDDYIYYADHTAKLVQEQWVDTVNHDGEWTEEEERNDPNEVLAVSFYPRTKPMEALEWKASENRLKPSSVEPPKLELKELFEHLEYTFL